MTLKWNTRTNPKNDTVVMVSVRSGDLTVSLLDAFYRDGTWYDGTPGDWYGDPLNGEVLAWMPFPKPYKPRRRQ